MIAADGDVIEPTRDVYSQGTRHGSPGSTVAAVWPQGLRERQRHIHRVNLNIHENLPPAPLSPVSCRLGEGTKCIATRSVSSRPSRARYIVIAFMVTLAMVTYLDRACIGTMKTTIQAEFGLTEGQFSWVFFSFILAYAMFEIPTARWAERRGTKNVFSRIVAWWSVFTLLTAASWNYASLLVTRFLFGAGEAGAFPCMARVMSRWIPFAERGTAKGIFFAGAYSSGALTALVVTALLPFFTWRVILVMFGLVGFIWVVAVASLVSRRSREHPAVNAAELDLIVKDRPPDGAHPGGWAFWRNLLQQRNVQLLCLLYMPNCATFYFCITWLPSYLQNQHGFEEPRSAGWPRCRCSRPSARSSSAATFRMC